MFCLNLTYQYDPCIINHPWFYVYGFRCTNLRFLRDCEKEPQWCTFWFVFVNTYVPRKTIAHNGCRNNVEKFVYTRKMWSNIHQKKLSPFSLSDEICPMSCFDFFCFSYVIRSVYTHVINSLMLLTHWVETKLPPFRRPHFEMRFLEWKCMDFT